MATDLVLSSSSPSAGEAERGDMHELDDLPVTEIRGQDLRTDRARRPATRTKFATLRSAATDPLIVPALPQAPGLSGAARKSGFGASQFTRRRTLVTKHAAQDPTQRVPTQRMVIKTEPDEDKPYTNPRALRTEASLAAGLDPRMDAITFPFDVSLRLEEIRLVLKEKPAKPLIKIDIAFRNVDQSTKSASPAVSTSFPMRLPPTSTTGSSVVLLDDKATRPIHLRIARNPLLARNPSGSVPSGTRAPRDQPDVRDILIRLSISDMGTNPPQKIYKSATSMTENSRLRLRGIRALRASAEGSQVIVNWTVQIPEQRATRTSPPSDTEIQTFLDREMIRYETKWRRETAERALALAEIERQASPAYGPPAMLVLDASAPSPASLIPGLERPLSRPSCPPPIFKPVPRYHYTGFANRGVPLVGSRLETFPQTKDWEDPTVANAIIQERVLDALDPGAEEGEGEQDEQAALHERLAEIEWRKRELIDYGSFAAPDPGRTARDFTVLKALFTFLQIDLVELAELEREAKQQNETENRIEHDRFAFERSLEESHVLTRALKLFKERTGRSANRVQQDHLLIDDEQIVKVDDGVEFCWLCGAYLCSVHAGTLYSSNEPTKAPFEPPSENQGGCDECGFSHAEQSTMASYSGDGDALEKALLANGMPALDPCTASLLLQRPVDKDAFAPPPLAAEPRRRTTKGDAKRWKKLAFPPVNSDGYSPCSCTELCSSECACVGAQTYCDRWCACPPSCPRRFRGCGDHFCDSSACICRDRCRECDPQICGCDAATCANSAIRLGMQKATMVVRSQIARGGYGAILLEPAQRGDFIALYGGEQHPQGLSADPTLESIWGHWKGAFSDTVEQSYWFDVDRGDATDSRLLGNVIRFVNHNRERANVVSRIIHVAGTHQIALYVLKPLKAGEEIFLDYGPGFVEPWMQSSEERPNL